MLLELNRLRGQREHFDHRFEPSAFDPQDDDYRVATPVDVSMDVEKAGKEAFRVTGRATTKLELQCGRCLEDFQVALPMKPLCSEACRGLCPECGTNLNRNDCGCAPKWEDPRLAELKTLVKPDQER